MADIDFGSFKPGEYSTESFSIPVDEQGTASVSGAGFMLEGFTDGDATATIKFTAGQVAAGTKTGTLTYGPNSLTQSLEATVEHELEVSSVVSVGSSTVGTAITKVATVTNRTDASATVTASGDFTVAPGSVPAGFGPQTVTITFTPTAVGTREATLSASASSLSASGELIGVGLETQAAQTATSPDDLESVTTSGSGSDTNTTYKVHVPSYGTKMHLGAQVTPFTSLNGFGLRTTAKGLLYADGNIGIRSTGGNVYLQADGSDSAITDGGTVTSVSKNNTIIAAGGGAYVLGDGGVTICTAVDVNPASSSDELPNPSDLTDGSSWASGIFAALDGLVAAASLVRVIWTTASGWDSNSKTDVGLAAVSGGAALTATVLGGFSVANAAGASFSVPGVTIYGHAGVLIGTPGFGGFYAAAGLVLGSIFPVVLGMDAELLGIRTANITGKNVNLDGYSSVTVRSHKDVTIHNGKTLTLKVDPAEFNQVGTDVNLLEMTKNITKMEVADTFRIKAGKNTFYALRLSDAGGVQLGVSDNAGLIDKNKPHAYITDTEIKIQFKDGGAHATITDGLVKCEDEAGGFEMAIGNNVASLQHRQSKHWVKVQNNMVSIQGGSAANKLQVKSSGLTFKGSQVQIG